MTAAPIALRPAFSFTHHAIARFTARVWPKLSSRPCADAREALSILADAISRAEVMPRRSSAGDTMWSVADPAMRWITRPGEFKGRRVAVVVTVLDGLEDVEAEESAERDVLEAHRRLTEVPEVGAAVPTLPPPAAELGSRAYRAWISLEAQRLAVERDRLATLRKMCDARNPAAAYARIQHQRISETQQETARKAKTERHALAMARDQRLAAAIELLRAIADRLAEIDSAGSSDLLERAKAMTEVPQ